MELQRFGIKVFAEDSGAVQLPELIPIFHRWIQTSAVDGLLIDVASYAHVHQGPGVLLVAHEGNYAMDATHGRVGLLYYRKQPLPGSLTERLAAVCGTVLRACRALEEAPELSDRMRFRGDEVLIIANDRLLAPNTEQTMETFRPALSALTAKLFDGADCVVSREPDTRERFAVTAKVPHTATVETLLKRLG